MLTSDVYALQVTCGAAEFNAQVNGTGRKNGPHSKVLVNTPGGPGPEIRINGLPVVPERPPGNTRIAVTGRRMENWGAGINSP
jgi:hypothetical protein